MNKEKVITIFIGLLLGATLAGSYFYWARFLNHPPKTSQNVAKVEKSLNIKSESSLEIDRPGKNSSTQEESVKVSGNSKPNQTLVIFANVDEKIATSDAQGKFDVEVKLEDGENLISVTAMLDSKSITQLVNITKEIQE